MHEHAHTWSIANIQIKDAQDVVDSILFFGVNCRNSASISSVIEKTMHVARTRFAAHDLSRLAVDFVVRYIVRVQLWSSSDFFALDRCSRDGSRRR